MAQFGTKRVGHHRGRTPVFSALLTLVVIMLFSCSSSDPFSVPQSLQVSANQLSQLLNGPVKHYGGRHLAQVVLSGDLSTVAAKYDDGLVVAWKTDHGDKPIFTSSNISEFGTRIIKLSANGKWIADVRNSKPGMVFMRNIAPGEKVTVINVGTLPVVEYLPTQNGSALIGTMSTDLLNLQSQLILALPSGRIQNTYSYHGILIRPIGNANGMATFNKSTGEYLAAATWESADYETHRGYLAWKPPSTPRLMDLHCDTEGSFSEDGQFFACGSGRTNHVLVWSLANNSSVATWGGNADYPIISVGSVSFVATGKGLAVEQGIHDSTNHLLTSINIYNIATQSVVAHYALNPLLGRAGLGSVQIGASPLLVYQVDESPDNSQRDLIFYTFPPGKVEPT